MKLFNRHHSLEDYVETLEFTLSRLDSIKDDKLKKGLHNLLESQRDCLKWIMEYGGHSNPSELIEEEQEKIKELISKLVI